MATAVLGTGLNGLVGSKLVSEFGATGGRPSYSFTNLDISDPQQPVDITDLAAVQAAVSAAPAEVIVHFAAFTDVNAAWDQRGDKTGAAYRVNVIGTQNLVTAAEAAGKHLIHISTAYVFNGEKTDPYTEADPVSPIEWYGQTKAEAEAVVQASSAPWTILRIDVPFRSDPFPRPDLVRKTIANIEQGRPLFSNHYIGPTFIDDFVKVIDWVIRTRNTGLYNASSGEQWSDYQFGQALNDTLQLGLEVKEGNLDDYLATSQRPYQRNTALNCDKLKKALDFEMQSISESLKTIQL